MTIKRIVRFNVFLAGLAILGLWVPQVLGVTDTTSMTLDINAGSLVANITSASVDLGDLTFSHVSQSIADINVGTVNIADNRGSGAGWDANWQGEDWSDGIDTLDYNGDGSATGQLCVDYSGTFDSTDVTVNGGTDDRANWSYGTDDCFDAVTTNVLLIDSTANKGNGDYTVATSVVLLDQFIPASQATGAYAADLTLDLI